MPRPTKLPYNRQSIDDADIAAVVEVLRGDWLTMGPAVARFEEALAERTGAAGCVAVSSGTAALHVAYAALGLGPGDELITTPITFAATANAARMLGADVVFADVEPDTGNIAVESVAAAITPRTRGIAAVHFGGLPVDLAPLSRLARSRGVWLLEDACHALGASYAGSEIGGCHYSDATVFSTHAIKNITTAEGGAVTSRRDDVLERSRLLRSHGIDKSAGQPGAPWSYDMHELGWNYRLSDLACALGASQLARLDDFLARRDELAALYRDQLRRRFGSAIRWQAPRLHRRSGRHLFATSIDFDAFGVTRGQLMHGLASQGVGTQVHYIPVYQLAYYRRLYGELALPNAEAFYRRELSLPFFVEMTSADVDRVTEELERQLVESRRTHGASLGHV